MAASPAARVLTVLGGVAVLVAIYLFISGSGYEVTARFYNAGQLVKGGEVRVAGKVVGSIETVSLGDDRLADVTIRITDGEITPIHQDARAQIRAIGAAGIANRYINLLPGSESAADLANHGVLPPEQTDGIVELDALLDTFQPKVRDDVQALVENGAEVFAGSGGRRWNSMLAKLDPALAQVQGVVEDVASDQAQLGKLITTGADAASAIASRRQDLTSAVSSSTEWMGAIAAQREHLSGALEGAPPALAAATRTLAKADGSISELLPALPSVTKAARPLGDVARNLKRTLPQASPVVRRLTDQLPAINSSLDRFDVLEQPLTAAFRASAPAFKGLDPIFEGIRMYSVDLVLGVVNGLAGIIGGNYNIQGHYFHANFSQSLQTLGTSPLSDILTSRDLIPGLINTRTGLTETCPGGLVPPAPDGSSPIDEKKRFCDPSDDVPASVNEPPKIGVSGDGAR